MFERLFQKAMGTAARLLFAAALLMLLWGVAFSVYQLSLERGDSVIGVGGGRWGLLDTLVVILSTAFNPALKLFFGAAVIYHLDLWVNQRRLS